MVKTAYYFPEGYKVSTRAITICVSLHASLECHDKATPMLIACNYCREIVNNRLTAGHGKTGDTHAILGAIPNIRW